MQQTKLTDYYSGSSDNTLTNYFTEWYNYLFNKNKTDEDNIELNSNQHQKRMTDYYNVLDKV
tara:strand:- start:284 stop:469 length:186 start_codon:yes stop_codon:yes gene_type:complete